MVSLDDSKSKMWVHFILLFYVIFFVKIQLSYFGSVYSITEVYMALFLLFAIMSVIINQSIIIKPTPVILVSILFIVSNIVSAYIVNYDLNDDFILAGSSVFIGSLVFLYSIILTNLLNIPKRESFYCLYKWIVFIYWVNFTLTIFQFFLYRYGYFDKDYFLENTYLNTVIFPDNELEHDPLRAPGLFTSGGGNASFVFICLAGYLFFVKNKNPFWGILNFLSSLLVVYLTLTRKVWLAIAVAVVVVLYLRMLSSKSYLLKLSNLLFIIFLSLSVIVITSALDITSIETFLTGKLSPESLYARFYQWNFYYNYVLDNFSLENYLFGLSALQELFDKYQEQEFLLIDNVFLSLFLYGGFVSLFLFSVFWMYWLVFSIRRYFLLINKNIFDNDGLFVLIVWIFFSINSLFSNFFTSIEGVLICITAFLAVYHKAKFEGGYVCSEYNSDRTHKS